MSYRSMANAVLMINSAFLNSYSSVTGVLKEILQQFVYCTSCTNCISGHNRPEMSCPEAREAMGRCVF